MVEGGGGSGIMVRSPVLPILHFDFRCKILAPHVGRSFPLSAENCDQERFRSGSSRPMVVIECSLYSKASIRVGWKSLV